MATSPLDHAPSLSARREVLLKREDLRGPVGGNKAPRFDAYFARHGRVREVVCLSTPGAHSFHVLKHYLTGPDRQGGAETLRFLEARARVDPYFLHLRHGYLHHPRIKVSTRPLWVQLLVYTLYRALGWVVGARTIGIGGAAPRGPNPHTEAMAECARQLDAAGHRGPVTHVMPVASGALAEGLLDYLAAHPALDHQLVGIMTGPALTRARLRLKFWRSARLRLVPAARLERAEIQTLTRDLRARTDVALDPLHTIQLAHALSRTELELGSTVVLWITSPRPS